MYITITSGNFEIEIHRNRNYEMLLLLLIISYYLWNLNRIETYRITAC